MHRPHEFVEMLDPDLLQAKDHWLVSEAAHQQDLHGLHEALDTSSHPRLAVVWDGLTPWASHHVQTAALLASHGGLDFDLPQRGYAGQH